MDRSVLDKNLKDRLLRTLLGLLFLTFFWQTRFSLFARNEVIDYLIPFIYLTDILVLLFLSGILIFYRRIFLSFAKLNFSRTFFFFLVFLLVVSISTLQAEFRTWHQLFKLLEGGGFAFGLAWFMSSQKFGSLRLLLKILSGGLVLESLIAWGEFLTGSSLGLQLLGEWRFSILTPGIAKVSISGQEFLRPYATFPHPNVLGGVLAIFAAVNLHFFVESILLRKAGVSNDAGERVKRLKFKGVAWATVGHLIAWIFFSATLFVTFSRSAWIAFVIMLAIDLVFSVFRFRRRLTYRVVTATIALLLLIFYSVFFSDNLIRQRFLDLTRADHLSITRRVELTTAALRMFRDHPLLGVGLNNFVPKLENYVSPSGQGRWLQPVHNVPLLILAETGLLGFLAWVVLIGDLVIRLLRLLMTQEGSDLWSSFGLFLSWIGVFVTSFFDHYWWSLQAGQLLFWLVVALTMRVVYNRR